MSNNLPKEPFRKLPIRFFISVKILDTKKANGCFQKNINEKWFLKKTRHNEITIKSFASLSKWKRIFYNINKWWLVWVTDSTVLATGTWVQKNFDKKNLELRFLEFYVVWNVHNLYLVFTKWKFKFIIIFPVVTIFLQDFIFKMFQRFGFHYMTFEVSSRIGGGVQCTTGVYFCRELLNGKWF